MGVSLILEFALEECLNKSILIYRVINKVALKPAVWHFKLKAKNAVGMSKFTQDHEFVLPEST